MAEKCSAINKRGTPCQAAAVHGSPFCALHGDPERAAELGRMGGLKNRHYVETDPVTIAKPSTPEDVQNVLAQTLVDMRAKKVDPRTATALAYVSGFLLKSFQTTDFEQRLARLEAERQKEDNRAEGT